MVDAAQAPAPPPDALWLRSRVRFARANAEMVIADCRTRVEKRLESQSREVRDQVTRFSEVADALESVRDHIPDAEDLGHGLPLVYRASQGLAEAARALKRCFTAFRSEHPHHVAEELCRRLDELCDWASSQPSVLRPHFTTYMVRFREGLRASSSDLAKISSRWDRDDAYAQGAE